MSIYLHLPTGKMVDTLTQLKDLDRKYRENRKGGNKIPPSSYQEKVAEEPKIIISETEVQEEIVQEVTEPKTDEEKPKKTRQELVEEMKKVYAVDGRTISSKISDEEIQQIYDNIIEQKRLRDSEI
jgi:thymidylate synthase